MPHWLFALAQLRRQLWLRVAAYSVLGLLTALAASAFSPWVPEDLAISIGTDAVDHVQSILASSMLAVATFSLATLVTAYTAIAAQASPRAARLMMSDGRGQGALATFVGAFIFAIVSIFALRTRYYGAQGRVILFFVTVGVLVLVVASLIRWIAQLSLMGQVDEAIDRVKSATEKGFRNAHCYGTRAAVTPPPDVIVVNAPEVGFVRLIRLDALEQLVSELGITAFLAVKPGDFVHVARPLLHYSGRTGLSVDEVRRLVSCFILGDRRTFDHDPRFGLTVLGEIAAKALSPGINDPGTAIDVMMTGAGLLSRWVRELRADPDPDAELPHLRLQVLSAMELLEDLFTPIAIYGASDSRVGVHLQQVLAALAALGEPEMAAAAQRHSAIALDRALAALELDRDRQQVIDAAHPLRARDIAHP